MLGRLISGLISNKLGDRLLIRLGIAVELIGILLVLLPAESYVVTAVGFVIIGTGMGPVYLLFFAVMNLGMLELAYRKLVSNYDGTSCEN